jgi:hypothetical protein
MRLRRRCFGSSNREPLLLAPKQNANSYPSRSGSRRPQRDLQAASFAADRAFRQYDADPENRLVASELEARWNKALARVGEIENKIASHKAAIPQVSSYSMDMAALAGNLRAVWSAPATDSRLKKRIVHTVIHEVIADLDGGFRDRPRHPLGWWSSHRTATAETTSLTKKRYARRPHRPHCQ